MNMRDKTVVVTGATNGIGKVTALELARLGARVLIVGRDPKRGEATLEEIRAQSGNANVELLLADLSLMSETRRLAQEVSAKTGKLDVLVNNAGAIFTEREETREGLEKTFALNHMSYFLLTNLLLETLKASGNARVVNVSSDAHRIGALNFEDLQARNGFNSMRVYGQSKLMNVLFSNELARRLQGTGVTSNALHPGVVATGFAQGSSGVWGWIFKLLRFVPGAMVTPQQGARTSIHLASSDAVNGITGLYFSNQKPTVPSLASLEVPAQQRLWLESERIAGLTAPVAAD
jgi:NAD(P)-dependent dehydrogenase (short-subunit alcohol dehydrogenase family)